MNFLDAYDISDPTTPQEGPTPTLNDEVNQVVGQLSRFWGGFRKQSQTVLEAARKDLSQVVSQAQQELTKLTTEDAESSSAAPDATTIDSNAEIIAGSSGEGALSSGNEYPADAPASPRSSHARGASMSATAQNLFSRLQASLPSNLASTVQAQLPDSFKQGASPVDFAQFRATLATEFQRVQGVTRAQAEEYVHKSEELFREAGEFLKDAVKVVPPEEGEATPGVLWDGTDVWMLPEMYPGGDIKGKGKERQTADIHRAGATRAEALLKQLRHDPEVIKVDPATDERAKSLWKDWTAKEVDVEEHGILSEKWTTAVQRALSDPEDGNALQQTMAALVPSLMPSEIFWIRYLFRVHQVELEEERRKALIEGTVESEEDINWESDDDETGDLATNVAPSHDTIKPSISESTTHLDASRETVTIAKTSVASTPATGSPRLSSEGSYDVVSSQVSNAGDIKAGEGEEHRKSGSDDEESDWE